MAVDPKENVTRQNIPQDPRNPKDHLDSGYESQPSLDFTIPPVGIEDIDFALHRLFDKTIGFNTFMVSAAKGPQNIKKPYVIFATGERFALAKKLKPPRDKNKVLILPAISIRRTAIEQAPDDITGRGMNQYTGVITIKRKLAPAFFLFFSRNQRKMGAYFHKIGLAAVLPQLLSYQRGDLTGH